MAGASEEAWPTLIDDTPSGRGAGGLRRDALANQERILAAAVTAILREGTNVPMATIAADAGVGVGTLYRRYPNREALLDALTVRSFQLLRRIASAAEARPGNALTRLSWWWDRVLEQREQLVLPLHGGPPVQDEEVRAERTLLHETLRRILEAGQSEGSIRGDVETRDIVLFGAILLTSLPGVENWEAIARRHKAIYLDGLAARHPTPLEL